MATQTTETDRSSSHKALIWTAAAIVVVLIARQPAVVFRAEFWAADGFNFFPESLELGVKSLTSLQGGHYSILPRAIAYLATYLPVVAIPYAYAIATLAAVALGLAWLTRDGFSWLIPQRNLRAALAIMLATVPGSPEALLNLANLHIVITLFALILLLENVGEKLSRGNVLFLIILLLSAAESAILLPILLLRLPDRGARKGWLAAVLALVGAVVLLETRSQGPIAGVLQSVLLIVESSTFRSVLAPILGPGLSSTLMKSSPFVFWPVFLGACLAVAFFLKCQKQRKPLLILLLAVLCLNGIMFFETVMQSSSPSLGLEALSRQQGNLFWTGKLSFLPSTIGWIFWFFTANWMLERVSWGRYVCWLLVAVLLIHNVAYYRTQYVRPNLDWPKSAAQISEALKMKRTGQLGHAVTLRGFPTHPNLCCYQVRIQP